MANRFRLVCSNEDGSFTIRGDEEIEKAIKGKENNKPTIFNEGIVLNWNMYAGMVPDKERNQEIFEASKTGSKFPEPSPFSKLLSEKFSKLPEKIRSEVDVEVSKEERKD